MPKLTFWLCTLVLLFIPLTSQADLSSYVKAYQKAGTSIVDMTNSAIELTYLNSNLNANAFNAIIFPNSTILSTYKSYLKYM